jgi:hypothetical protein
MNLLSISWQHGTYFLFLGAIMFVLLATVQLSRNSSETILLFCSSMQMLIQGHMWATAFSRSHTLRDQTAVSNLTLDVHSISPRADFSWEADNRLAGRESLLSLFWKNERRLMRPPCCLRICMSVTRPNLYWGGGCEITLLSVCLCIPLDLFRCLCRLFLIKKK